MFSRITMTALICFIAFGCSAEWIIPEGYIVECIDNSDCPDTAECTLSDDGASQVCVTAGETWCGNGVQEVGEACDDGDDNTGEYGTSARCNLDCLSLAPHCGDGEVKNAMGVKVTTTLCPTHAEQTAPAPHAAMPWWTQAKPVTRAATTPISIASLPSVT